MGDSSGSEYSDLFRRLVQPVNQTIQSEDDNTIKKRFDQRIKDLGITINNAVELIGIEHKSLLPILDGTAKRVDLVNAIKLAHFLNVTIEDFAVMYTGQLEASVIGQIERAKKGSYLSTSLDLKGLKSENFVKNINSVESIEDRVNTFFGLQSIYEYSDIGVKSAFSRSKRDSNALMREFWVKSASIQFRNVANPYDFSRSELIDLLPKIRPYTQDIEAGLLTVIKALYRIGVTVIYQPYLKAIQVRGATMVINGKPCIVLTDYLNRYTTLWHTLIHELHHVLYDLEEIQKREVHLSGQPDLFLVNENKADEFARQYLFSPERSNQILPFINDEIIVKRFTDSAQVHASFAYAYYLHDLTQKGYTNAWGNKLAKKIPVCQASLSLLNTRAFEKDTLKESIEYLKKVVFNV